ncbi:MAG: hypothetical protein H7Y38_00985 [Armatimonadetes bacterium]|nr:hypothetical protein [Armatimonadota bacterium]
MYETLSLAILADARLPADWMTVYVGVRGIELGGYCSVAHLPMEEVQAFALDALAGAVGTPDEWNIYQVADADRKHDGTEPPPALRELAKATGVSVDTARRKWRYAVITDVLPRVTEAERRSAFDPGWDLWCEISNELHDLLDGWSAVCAENPPPEAGYLWDDDAEAKWQATITAYNEWREREYAALTAETERGAIQ